MRGFFSRPPITETESGVPSSEKESCHRAVTLYSGALSGHCTAAVLDAMMAGIDGFEERGLRLNETTDAGHRFFSHCHAVPVSFADFVVSDVALSTHRRQSKWRADSPTRSGRQAWDSSHDRERE